jgi:hypothetical protein
MYRRKRMGVFWRPFSPPCGGKDKHQEKNNKKKHAMLQHQKDPMLIEIKGYEKPAYTIITLNLVY